MPHQQWRWRDHKVIYFAPIQGQKGPVTFPPTPAGVGGRVTCPSRPRWGAKIPLSRPHQHQHQHHKQSWKLKGAYHLEVWVTSATQKLQDMNKRGFKTSKFRSLTAPKTWISVGMWPAITILHNVGTPNRGTPSLRSRNFEAEWWKLPVSGDSRIRLSRRREVNASKRPSSRRPNTMHRRETPRKITKIRHTMRRKVERFEGSNFLPLRPTLGAEKTPEKFGNSRLQSLSHIKKNRRFWS